MTKRTRIGRSNSVATRQIIYRTPQGIEIDELDHFEIVRKRVLYEDVLLVTFHRQHGTAYIAFMAVAVLFFGALAAITKSVPPLAASLAAVAGIALVFGVTRFLLQLDVITVFGRRSKAAIRYPYRKAFARRMYGEICASVAAAQRRVAREERGLTPHPDLGPPPDLLEGSDLPSPSGQQKGSDPLSPTEPEGTAEGGLTPHPDLGPPPDLLEGSDLPSSSGQQKGSDPLSPTEPTAADPPPAR